MILPCRMKLADNNMRNYFFSKKSGVGLVEIIVAVAIIFGTIIYLALAGRSSFVITSESASRTRAGFLMEEGIEAVKILRDFSWAENISPAVSGSTKYLYFDSASGNWILTDSDPGKIEGLFTRTIIFDDVYRKNSDDDIVDVSSGEPKTLDQGTKKVTVTVSWTASGGITKSESISTYITNLFQN